MEKNWVEPREINREATDQLAADLKITRLLAALLMGRGIDSYDKAHRFFRPTLAMLHDPFLMQDMGKAIQRIEQAIENKEKILIYGDYDVDGTTAVSLVYSFFLKVHPEIQYYIPNRYKEGYGVSMIGVDYAIENNYALIICLDCGIKANDTITYAKKNGVDFIVCDHHLPGDELPPAVAILDPKRADCSYPYNELSGCGIGFKLIQAYAQKNSIAFEELLSFLDLAAISIASDIVPITGENRVLAYFGLKQVNADPRPGIKAIIDSTKTKHELSIENLVFIIGPRINAAGRIKTGMDAVELLISTDKAKAEEACTLINQHNNERRDLDKAITQEALDIIKNDETLINRKTTVLFKPDWHKGVIGIVASRLIENYYRPTIVLTSSNGMASGSARSVTDFSVYNAIKACEDLLEQFGGHKYAAGLTLKVENIPAFQEKFEKVVGEQIENQLLVPHINIDAEIKFSEITPKFFRILKQFAPFGPNNMMPVFKTKGVMDNGWASTVGDDGKHLRFKVYQQENSNINFGAIGFNLGNKLEIISSGKPFNICYTIEENHWNDQITLQLNVKDIQA